VRRGRPAYPDVLTPREWEVLSLIKEGLINPQIAQRLAISESGARFHVSEILSKLGLESRQQAASWQRAPRRPLALGGLLVTSGAGAAIALAVVGLILLAVGVLAMDLRTPSDADIRPPVTGPAFRQFQKGSFSLQAPADWQYKDVDGHDFSVITLSSASRVEAVALLSGSSTFPDYGNERREPVVVAGSAAQVIKGVVQNRTGLNDYIGPMVEAPLANRIDLDIHAGQPGEEEWRIIVPLNDFPGGRVELAMVIRNDEDRRIFERIIQTMTLP
jgi:DNA-binding CsgD family transcriptional regulator